jgi:hypothetical protein
MLPYLLHLSHLWSLSFYFQRISSGQIRPDWVKVTEVWSWPPLPRSGMRGVSPWSPHTSLLFWWFCAQAVRITAILWSQCDQSFRSVCLYRISDKTEHSMKTQTYLLSSDCLVTTQANHQLLQRQCQCTEHRMLREPASGLHFNRSHNERAMSVCPRHIFNLQLNIAWKVSTKSYTLWIPFVKCNLLFTWSSNLNSSDFLKRTYDL